MSQIIAADVQYILGVKATEFDKAIDDSRKKVWGIDKDVSEAARTMTKSFGLAGAGITAAFGAAVREGTQFKTAMAEVATLGVKELKAIEAGALKVATTYGTDIVESAKGAYQVISATGFDGARAVGILDKAAQAAAAGVSSVTASVELGTGVMNAFGIQAESIGQVYDQAFIAVKSGVTTFDELASSVGAVSPTFEAAGLASDEMFASIAALTKGGLGTSEAVTGMKAALTNLIKPSKEAADMAKSLGLQFDVAALESEGLAGFLDQVQEATGGNVEKMGKLFGSVEALNAVLTLTGSQSESFNEILADMRSGVAATDEAFQIMVANDPSFAWRQLKTEMSLAAVAIQEALAPSIAELSGYVREAVGTFTAWRQENPELFASIVKVVGVVGLLGSSMGALGLVIPPVVAAFTLLTSPIVLATGAISGIAWAVKSLYEDWEWMWPEMVRIWNDFSRALEEGPAVLWAKVKEVWDTGWDGIYEGTKEAFDGIGSYFNTTFDEWIESFGNLQDRAAEVWKNITSAITGPIDTVKSAMSELGEKMSGWFGHSTWIDDFENLERQSRRYFGDFQRHVVTSLAITTASMATFGPAMGAMGAHIVTAGMGSRTAAEEIHKVAYESEAAGGKLHMLGEEHKMAGIAASMGFTPAIKAAADHLLGFGLAALTGNTSLVGLTGGLGDVIDEFVDVRVEAGRTSPELEKMLEKIRGNNKAMEDGAPIIHAYGSAWGDAASGISQAALEMQAFQEQAAKFGGFTGTFNMGSSRGFKPMRSVGSGGGSIQDVLGLPYTIQEISEMTGKALQDLHSDFTRYTLDMMRKWDVGMSVHILTFEEWAHSLEATQDAVRHFATEYNNSIYSVLQEGEVYINGIITKIEDLKRATSSIGSGSTVTVNLPGIEGFASGGVTRHEVVMVGERGPELAALPVGTRVMSHADMMSAVRGFASGGVVSGSAMEQSLALTGGMYIRGVSSAIARGAVASLRRFAELDQNLANDRAMAAGFNAALMRDDENFAAAERARAHIYASTSIPPTSSGSGFNIPSGFGGLFDDGISAIAGSSVRGTSNSLISGGTQVASGGGNNITVEGALVHIEHMEASDPQAAVEAISQLLYAKLEEHGITLNMGPN